METKEMFKSQYMSWDDVSNLGSVERLATILDDGRLVVSKYDVNKRDLVLTLQLTKNHEIFDFRVQKRTWRNLKEKFGTDTSAWRGKQVSIEPFIYKEGKTSIELKPLEELKNPKKISTPNFTVSDAKLLDEYLEGVTKAFIESQARDSNDSGAKRL